MGLAEVQRSFALPARIKVLPEQFASREELLKDRGAELLLLDKATRTRQHGAGTEFESLTEYREGDDPRRIDWRATARIQRPVVRRFQIERHRDVMEAARHHTAIARHDEELRARTAIGFHEEARHPFEALAPTHVECESDVQHAT